jgi:hypothetical protein
MQVGTCRIGGAVAVDRGPATAPWRTAGRQIEFRRGFPTELAPLHPRLGLATVARRATEYCQAVRAALVEAGVSRETSPEATEVGQAIDLSQEGPTVQLRFALQPAQLTETAARILETLLR